jgi:hypothetical protein
MDFGHRGAIGVQIAGGNTQAFGDFEDGQHQDLD